VPLKTFLERNPKYRRLALGTLVFHQDRLLLVQRSATEHAFPNCWEFPGGKCDDEDETILHGAARELFEETGLRATKFIHQIGNGVEFSGRNPLMKWVKLSFEVEVERPGRNDTEPSTGIERELHNMNILESFTIRLDPVEHQDCKWVTEEEILQCEADGVKLEFMSSDQRQVILEAFRLRKA
jgi:8-oxo-dGTP pyrophosphatase MutT (NUDIX family)